MLSWPIRNEPGICVAVNDEVANVIAVTIELTDSPETLKYQEQPRAKPLKTETGTEV